MFTKLVNWFKRLLLTQYRLANDAQYWRPAYYWKALFLSAIGCIAIIALMIASIMTISFSSEVHILLANMYCTAIFAIGIAVVLPLALRYNSVAECIAKRLRTRG